MDSVIRRTPGDDGWHAWLFLAVAVLAFAVVASLGAVTAAACGSGSGAALSPTIEVPETQQPSAVASTPEPRPSITGTPAAMTPTPRPGATVTGPGASPDYVDDSTEVPCTIDAPLDQHHRVARDCVIGPLVTVEGYLLNAEAAEAYRDMKEAAAKAGINLFIISAYRPFDVQWQLYWAEVAKYGPNQNTSAKPGHSEHQLGTTIDLNELTEEFGDSPAGRWLQENAWQFGFRMSYPRGREEQTGYAYEPWHWRYWGR